MAVGNDSDHLVIHFLLPLLFAL